MPLTTPKRDVVTIVPMTRTKTTVSINRSDTAPSQAN